MKAAVFLVNKIVFDKFDVGIIGVDRSTQLRRYAIERVVGWVLRDSV
jgi:hypothetical protein